MRNGFLMWYMTEQVEYLRCAPLTSIQNPETSGIVKGTITLADCVLSKDEHPNSFRLETSHGVVYLLTCQSPAELKEWMDAIKVSIEEATQVA